MEYYISAMRAAVQSCDEPTTLKNMFDFLIEQALEEYRAGALDIAEYGDIANEYADTLTNINVINYL